MQFHVVTWVIGRKAQSKGACRFSCWRKVVIYLFFFFCKSWYNGCPLIYSNMDSHFSSSVLWKSQWPAVMSTLIPTRPPWQAVILLANTYSLVHRRAVTIATKVVVMRITKMSAFQFVKRVQMRWMTYREREMSTSWSSGTCNINGTISTTTHQVMMSNLLHQPCFLFP